MSSKVGDECTGDDEGKIVKKDLESGQCGCCKEFWEVYVDSECKVSGGAIAIYVVIGLVVLALIAALIYFSTRTKSSGSVPGAPVQL